jgi:hypothetical protein
VVFNIRNAAFVIADRLLKIDVISAHAVTRKSSSPASPSSCLRGNAEVRALSREKHFLHDFLPQSM